MEPPLFKVSYCDLHEKNVFSRKFLPQTSVCNTELLVHCTAEAVERHGNMVSRS